MDDKLKEKFFREHHHRDECLFELHEVYGDSSLYNESTKSSCTCGLEKEWQWIEANTIPKEGKRLTRVEVIDGNGRSYINWDEDNKVDINLQDDGRTLKIFIKNDEKLPNDIEFIPKDKVKEIVKVSVEEGFNRSGEGQNGEYLHPDTDKEYLLRTVREKILKQLNLED